MGIMVKWLGGGGLGFGFLLKGATTKKGDKFNTYYSDGGKNAPKSFKICYT
jgi:hypothetical protein